MKRIIVVTMLIIVPLFCLAFVGTQVKAETVNYRTFSYISKAEAIPVPDAKGHMLALVERRGVAVFEDGSAAAYHGRYVVDVLNGQGPFQGYGEMTYPDGAKTIVKWEGTLERPAGKELSTLTGKGEYIKGTGRFEGIQGTVSISGRYITPYGKETKGEVVINNTATYKLPFK